ncbi:hypothetical protein SLS60_009479 [Paraconiothyrium brasiliense]|uniref:Uncharacterized protein n=1 Tax=Paraconiothyrium brasiliense TaxID=300254 RepID=A0ABR3QUH1_9PLEO
MADRDPCRDGRNGTCDNESAISGLPKQEATQSAFTAATEPYIKTEDKAERSARSVRDRTIEVVSLLSPETEARPSQETNEPGNCHSRSISLRPKPGLKREAGDEVEGVTTKRNRGPGAEASREDPFLAALNAAVEQYRQQEAAEKSKLQDKIENLEAQLTKSQEEYVRLQAQIVASETSHATVITGPDDCSSDLEPAATQGNSAVNRILKRSIADLLAKNAGLRHDLHVKDEELSTKNEEIQLKNKMLRSREEDLRDSEHRLTAMAEDLREQKVLRREADSALRSAEAENQKAAESLKSMEENYQEQLEHKKALANILKDKEQRLNGRTYKRMVEGRRNKQKPNNFGGNYRKQIGDLRTALDARGKTIEGLRENLRFSNDTLRKTKAELLLECAKSGNLMARNKKLSTVQIQKDLWEMRAKNMYSVYQDVLEKNEELVEKVKGTLEVCQSGTISKKTRMALEKLKGRPLEELSAFTKTD